MGLKIIEAVGFFLSLGTALVGAGSAVLGYFAGQEVFDWRFIHADLNAYPTGVYAAFVQKAWACNFIYILPGVTGMIAFIAMRKWVVIVHLTLAVLMLLIGTIPPVAVWTILLISTSYGDSGPWRVVCSDRYSQYGFYDNQMCQAVRMSLGAGCMAFGALILVLAEILYCAFTYHSIGKYRKTRHKYDALVTRENAMCIEEREQIDGEQHLGVREATRFDNKMLLSDSETNSNSVHKQERQNTVSCIETPAHTDTKTLEMKTPQFETVPNQNEQTMPWTIELTHNSVIAHVGRNATDSEANKYA